jgi:hypothetical protein
MFSHHQYSITDNLNNFKGKKAVCPQKQNRPCLLSAIISQSTGARMIDTPRIRMMEISCIIAPELSGYFPEFNEYAGKMQIPRLCACDRKNNLFIRLHPAFHLDKNQYNPENENFNGNTEIFLSFYLRITMDFYS